jgi:hypothetical protein
MSDDERSYDDGYAAGYAEGFVDASSPTAKQPTMDVLVICTCTVTSGGVPSPNPGCPMHAWWLVVDHQSGEG